jgi:uncharacterized protein (TIGR03435 family)
MAKQKTFQLSSGRTLLLITCMWAQASTSTAAAPPLAFEVATVKPDKSPNGMTGSCHGSDSNYKSTQTAPPLGRCVINSARLSHLISIAYDLHSTGLIKGSDWMTSGDERYNVEAQAENPATVTEQQLHEMLQTLLADRFKLKFHRETIEMPGFDLVTANKGPKLKISTGEDVVTHFGGEFYKPLPGRPVSLTARKYSIRMLADLLSGVGEHGPVIDKTGLAGAYDFELSWDENAGPDLSTALREQLGLRLESQKKVPVSFFVIDSAQKPDAN